MAGPARSDPDRLLVREGWKHFRRTYSTAEVRWGLLTFVAIAGIATWIGWRGAHPDPELFAEPPLAGGEGGSATAEERGPMPEGIAPSGWREGEISHFAADTLYVKINGRADFFLSKGFARLTFVALADESDESRFVDIELYDMGSAANAVGIHAAERPAGAVVKEERGTVSYRARNALFLARGDYYVRAIGSDESPEVMAALEEIGAALQAGLAAGERPWAYALYVDVLGLAPAQVAYQPQNAFSFGFARDVFIAERADESEWFVVVKTDPAAAEEMAAAFVDGFLSYGSEADGGPPRWVEDRYLGTMATAIARGRFVLGVRGAPDVATGKTALDELEGGLGRLPDAVRAAALPGAPVNEPAAGEGESEGGDTEAGGAGSEEEFDDEPL